VSRRDPTGGMGLLIIIGTFAFVVVLVLACVMFQ